jgi:hypothetical protein
MATILVQSTLRAGDDDAQLERLSELVTILRTDGHETVVRYREPGPAGDDPVLSSLDRSSFDQLWLFAADRSNGLSPADVRGILRFRERGGAILAVRDNENTGYSLLNLGSVGLAHDFRTYNRTMSRRIIFKNDGARVIPLADAALAIDGECGEDGRPFGRAVAFQTHLDGGAEHFDDIARTIARWLATASRAAENSTH